MRKSVWFALMLAPLMGSHEVGAARLKDLGSVRGARPNHLVGYGIVVGLAGTGDDQSARFSAQAVVSMLKRLGTLVDPSQLRLRNVAAVIVTASLPPFISPGQKIDVTVSSIGNAASLQGGTLLTTPLKGTDLRVYAIAQGPLSVGGYSGGGSSGSKTAKNHTTVGRVPGGALVEREVPLVLSETEISIGLNAPDFTTAVRIASAIEEHLSKEVAKHTAEAGPPADEAGVAEESEPAATIPRLGAWAADAGTIVVSVPKHYQKKLPMLISQLEALTVDPDVPTRVVINERTGTVVMGDRVRISPVAIAHGGLTLEVQETPIPSQPGAFASGGTTVVVPNTTIKFTEKAGDLHEIKGGASLGDVVKALNAIGASPRDLVAILQALKASGSLHAELEIL